MKGLQQFRHISDKGFDKQWYLDLIAKMIREHGPVSRKKIDELLLDKLPEVLTEKQKKDKVHNLLRDLVIKGIICNEGSRRQSKWQLTQGERNITNKDFE